MSLWARLTRAIDTLATIDLDEGRRYGMLGEDAVANVIEDVDGCYVHNPVLPHPTRPGFHLECDFLVLAGGNLFVIEVKNYRGRIYQTHTEEHQVTRGFFFRRTEVERVPVPVSSATQADELWQDKPGNHGEGVFTKRYRHPMRSTRSFIFQS